MTRKSLKYAIAASAMAIITSTGALAEGKELMTGASAKMLADTCAGCHGTNGASGGPATPTIAGLSTEYFVEVMEGFKNGEVPSTIMGRIAKGYSEDEFKAMAEYYGKLPFVRAKGQEFNAKLVKKGAKIHDKYCEKCHADGGTKAEDDSGILAGQWQPYLRWTLADYIKEHRVPTKKMRKKLKKMLKKKGDKGVEALMNYYASQQ
jgi:sulfide dehydrogenase cytochrome subunit